MCHTYFCDYFSNQSQNNIVLNYITSWLIFPCKQKYFFYNIMCTLIAYSERRHTIHNILCYRQQFTIIILRLIITTNILTKFTNCLTYINKKKYMKRTYIKKYLYAHIYLFEWRILMISIYCMFTILFPTSCIYVVNV